MCGWPGIGGFRTTLNVSFGSQNRTADTTVFSRVLYRLSYLGRFGRHARGLWFGEGRDDAFGGGL